MAVPGGSGCAHFADLQAAVRGVYTPARGFALAAIVMSSFLLLISSSWRASPDSALYLELGESLASGKGYVFNEEPHTYVPPGYPALIAVTAWLRPSFLGYRILMALTGICTAAAGYYLVKKLLDRDTALLVGGVFAVNHVLLCHSATTTSDVPFALVVLLSLHVLVRASAGEAGLAAVCFAGIMCGLPPLVRVNGWGIPPAGAIFLFSSWRQRDTRARWTLTVLFLVAAIIPGTLWELHKLSLPQSFSEGTYFNAVVGRSLGTLVAIMRDASWEYVSEMNFALTGLSIKTGVVELLVPTVVAIGALVALKRGERLFVPLVAIQMCGLILSPAGSRYLIALLPGLYLFLGVGIVRILGWLGKRTNRRPPGWIESRNIVIAFFSALIFVNAAHNVIPILEARQAVQSGGAETIRDVPFFRAASWLKNNAPHAVVLSMHPRVLHYLSGSKTVELVRSGVPEHEVWVNRTAEIRCLIQRTEPAFLFSDASNATMLASVRDALHSLGLELVEVREASTSRFQLWRLVPSASDSTTR
ncbi:MAG: glycosyltransferase family 39 protein [Thermodesulfobacteriota bacterium]